jgi:hypothetical protein
MGDVMNGLLALTLGAFVSYGALRALAAMADDVRRARVLRRRGRTAAAVIVSLAELDPECPTRQAVVRFEVEPGREVNGTAQLRWKGRPDLVPGARVQIRYDPANPTFPASEAGRRQGRAEIRQAVIVSALMLVMVLPTSIYLIYAGLHTMLF